MHNNNLRSHLQRFWQWRFTPYLLLSAIIFFAHFLFFRRFGIYEDDLAFVGFPYNLDVNLKELGTLLLHHFKAFQRGRPFGEAINILLVLMFRHLNGLDGIYIAGMISIILNASLVYMLIHKISRSRFLSFLCAVVFTLFPADTTHTFLTHNLSLQYTLTWVLMAFLFYLSKPRWPAFIFLTLVLFTYETPYWLFFAAPFFIHFRQIPQKQIPHSPTQKICLRKLFTHALIMMGIFGLYLLFRIVSGEDRMGQMFSNRYFGVSFYSIPFRAMFGLILGPMTSLSAFIEGPIETFRTLTAETLTGILLSIPLLLLVLSKFQKETVKPESDSAQIKLPFLNMELHGNAHTLSGLRLLLISLGMWALAYVMSFPFYPLSIYAGRLTSVHMAAAIPGSIFIGSCLYLGYAWFNQQKKGFLALLGISLFLGLLIGYRIRIQMDFVLAWKKIQRMTTQVLDQIQDVGPQTTVFIDPKELKETRFIEAYNNQYIINNLSYHLYDLPVPFRPTWMMLSTDPQRNAFYYEDGQYYYDYSLRTANQPPIIIKDQDIIFITWNGQRFVRQYGEINILGKTFQLKPPGPSTLDQFEKKPLYDWFYQPEYLHLEGPIELDTLFK